MCAGATRARIRRLTTRRRPQGRRGRFRRRSLLATCHHPEVFPRSAKRAAALLREIFKGRRDAHARTRPPLHYPRKRISSIQSPRVNREARRTGYRIRAYDESYCRKKPPQQFRRHFRILLGQKMPNRPARRTVAPFSRCRAASLRRSRFPARPHAHRIVIFLPAS